MNPKIKWSLLGVAGFALVCILGLYMYLTPARLRGFIVPAMEKSLERKAELDDIGLSLWGGIAASIEGLTIHDRAGFGADPFLSARGARFELAFWPLLSGQTNISGITVDEPTFSYVVNEQGESNIDDLMSDKEEGGGGGAILPAGAIRIRNGSFAYTDRRDNTRIRVDGIDYTVELDLQGGGLGVAGELAIASVRSGDGPALGPLSLAHRIRLRDGAVEIESLRPGAFGLSAEWVGRIRMETDSPQIILRLVEQTVDLGDLNRLLQKGSATPPVTGRVTLAGSVEGPWNPDGSPPAWPSLSLTLTAADLSAVLPGLAEPAVLKHADVQIINDTVSLKRFELEAAGSDIRISGRAKGAVPWPPGQPASTGLDFSLSETSLSPGPLLALLSPESALDIRGDIRVSASVKGPYAPEETPPVYPVLQARIHDSDLTVRTPDIPVPLRIRRTDLTLRDATIALARSEITAGRSDIRLSGTAGAAVPWPPPRPGILPSRPQINLKLQSSVLDVDEIAPPDATSDAGWSLVSPAFAATALPPSPIPGIVRAMDGSVRMDVGRFTSEAIVYKDFAADVVARDRTVTVRPMQAVVFGGRMSGWAELVVPEDTTANRFPFKAELDLSAVQAGELLKGRLRWDLPLSGLGRVLVTASGALDPALEVVTGDLNADGSVAFENGRLANWQLLKQATAGVADLSFLNTDTIAVRDLRSPFRVAGGRLFIDNMQLLADGMLARVSGSGGLEDGSLDLALDLDVPASRLNVGGLNISGVASALFGSKRDPVIPVRIRVTGTADRPAIGVDLQPAGRQLLQDQKAVGEQKLKAEADSTKARAKQKVEDEAKKAAEKAKGFLKKFGK